MVGGGIMSWAGKCDRCGRYFDWINKEPDGFAFLKYDYINGGNSFVGRKHDLCPKCIESLEKWMNVEEDDD